MPKYQSIEEKIEAALESLTGARRASPGPFFFTRLQERLREKKPNIWETITVFISKPVVAFALCIVVLFNGVLMFQNAENTSSSIEQIDLADDYNVAVTSPIIDYENPEP